MIDSHTMTEERFNSIVTTIHTDDFVEACFSGGPDNDNDDDFDHGLILGLLAQCEELQSWQERGFSHRLVLFHSLDVTGATTDYMSLWLVDLQELANSYPICTEDVRRSTRTGRPYAVFHERVIRVLATNPEEDVLQHMYRHELQHSILHNKQQHDDQITTLATVSERHQSQLDSVCADIKHHQTAIRELHDASPNTRQLVGGEVDDCREEDTNSNKWMCVYMCFAGVLVYHIYFG